LDEKDGAGAGNALGERLVLADSNRRPHSLAFDRDHVAALGPRRNVVRDACLPEMGVVAKLAM
jgi:hypothetical protein